MRQLFLGSLMWSLLQAVVVIGLFFVVPVIVVGAQIALFQLVAMLGEVEADQSSFEDRLTGAENGILAEPQRVGARVCIGDSDASVRDGQPVAAPDGPLSARIAVLGL
jgi:hypothetical protein